MSLRHILLGMLGNPTSGYDLKREFEQGAAHYWAADLAQIYPALKKMEQLGWLTSESAPSEKGPPRKLYSRTPAGLAELCDWVRTGPTVGTQRAPWAAQIEFAHLTDDPAVTLQLIDGIRSHFAPFCELLEQAIEDEFAEPMNEEDFHAYLTIKLGVRTIRGRLDWCDEAEGLVRQRYRDNFKETEQ